MVRDVFGDHRSSADEGMRADANAAYDGGIGADGHATADARGLVAGLLRIGRAWPAYVGENRRRSHENLIFQLDAVVESGVILDAAAVAQVDAGCYEAPLSKHASRSDARAVHHVRVAPDDGARAEDRSLLDISGRMNAGQEALPYNTTLRFHDGSSMGIRSA